MVTSYAIVAIPSKDDYIWNISSEKVPHLTLLYMDAHFENPGQVEEFVRHVADTSLRRFYLNVKRRGPLGDKSADVLFLEGYDLKMLELVRGYFLNNPDIFKAYHAVEQFPSWTPHLTLGYPETPAKPDERDYPGIHSIAFDRIALWTGDYEGVEFPLKGLDSFEMSVARGEDFLEHYGVKGMKWGVIRSGAKTLVMPSNDAVQAQVVKARAKIGGVHTLSNKDLQHLIRRMDLEVKYKDLKDIQHHQSLVGKGLRVAGRIIENVFTGVLVSWLRRPGRSPVARPHGGPDLPPIRVIGSVGQRAIGS